jgi:hypothetical protein
MNVKLKNINTEAQLELLIEHIMTECDNLELQEIEYIFKSGIKGVFGTIYNDISIDTICGKEGWFESYYRDHRVRRQEPKQEIYFKPSGEEITEEEYFNRYPEEKNKVKLSNIGLLARNGMLRRETAELFYELKGLTTEDFSNDIKVFSHNYRVLSAQGLLDGYTESDYIREQFTKFVLENLYKTKEPEQPVKESNPEESNSNQ